MAWHDFMKGKTPSEVAAENWAAQAGQLGLGQALPSGLAGVGALGTGGLLAGAGAGQWTSHTAQQQQAFMNQTGTTHTFSALLTAQDNISQLLSDNFLASYPEFENWALEEMMNLWRTRCGTSYDFQLHKRPLGSFSTDEMMFAHLSCFLMYRGQLESKIDITSGAVVLVIKYPDDDGDH